MLQLSTIFFLMSFSVFAAIHMVATELSLYWLFWWFDMPMHLLGGIVVALGLFSLHDLGLFLKDRHLNLVSIMLLVFLVAMGWEVFELAIGVPIQGDYVVDTLTDLCMGTLGGLVGYGVGTSIKKL